MAKCIKNQNTGEIKRLMEKDQKDIKKIQEYVKSGWDFIKKSEWKDSLPKPEVKKEKHTKK
jgi:hypothetical protein